MDSETSDGTALIEETQLDGQTDHIIVHCAHTELVYSEKAFFQIHHFLLKGQFIKTLEGL